MKKILALLLAVLMVFGLVACGTPADNGDATPTSPTDETTTPTDEGYKAGVAIELPGTTEVKTDALKDLKIGFIFLHDENSTYDLNFINAANEVKAKLQLSDDQVILKKNIGESADCYQSAVELAEAGCDIVFADSFGHEDYMIQAATEYPDVQFCHATGTKAHTQNLPNFHNAFASIYEGRFLAGVVAGMKLNEMIAANTITAEQAKIGYVGAMPYAEVKSGMTSFYLGAKYVCPTATIDVKYTESWYDETKEMEYANALIQDGCVLISQHADSMGAPNACEAAGVPNVSYNGSTNAACPKTFLISSRINWAPYFEYIISCVTNGQAIATDYCGNLSTGSVELSEMGATVAPGTAEKIEEIKAQMIAGTFKVFDTNTFTVGGQKLESYGADVDSDANFAKDTEAIVNGEFAESEFRSAPYFDIDIDGVTTK